MNNNICKSIHCSTKETKQSQWLLKFGTSFSLTTVKLAERGRMSSLIMSGLKNAPKLELCAWSLYSFNQIVLK